MATITIKSRSYLYLLFVLIAITMVMPLISTERILFNNLVAVGFFFFFILTALKTLTTRGIAPKSRIIIWLIKATTALAFLSDLSHAILQSIVENSDNLPAAGDFMSHLSQNTWWLQSIYCISLAGYSALIIILIIFIIRDIFSGERVTLDKIFGAITVYFLLGVLWTTLYHMTELYQPGSLIWASGNHLKNYFQVQYFSFTTLCTVGYGDIIPGNKLTMMLSNLEAIVGSLYLAILVARLVGLYTAQVARDKYNSTLSKMEKESAEIRKEYQTIEKELKER